MKANQLATLALRLMGIYYLVEAVSGLSFFIGPLFEGIKGSEFSMAIGGLATLAVTAIVGILLIIFSIPWGKKLTPEDTSEEKNSAITFKQVQVLAFALAGILIFANALPQLFTAIAELRRWMYPPDAYPYPNRRDSGLIASAAGTLLKAALGLWLCFGARGFANFWSSLRNFAAPKPPPAQ